VVGARIAGLLRAVGVTLDGAGSRPRGATEPFRRIVGSSSLAEIVGDYDLVVVAAALTAGTRGSISADVLHMRSAAELINAGRGKIVDELAPAAAPAEARLGGAGLDVFETEPLHEAGPLRSLPDFFGWRKTLREVFIENFRRFTEGRRLRNVVDKRLGYVGSASLVGTSREGGIG
jgi:phosphoglycerate dehydrogenase-like enzyme